MKSNINTYFTMTILILLGFTLNSHAESSSALPVSTQTTEEGSVITIDKIELVSEVIIDSTSTSDNPSLKEGVACDDENLEPAELGPDFEELPMANTIPCSGIDCSDLAPATLHKDNYKKLPMAKTTKLCDK